jgi:hypothetical protein
VKTAPHGDIMRSCEHNSETQIVRFFAPLRSFNLDAEYDALCRPCYASTMRPSTRYARSGELNIAYQLIGDGPLDVIYVPGWVSNLDHAWAFPPMVHVFERLSRFRPADPLRQERDRPFGPQCRLSNS